MKTTITSIFASFILLSSCGEAAKTDEAKETPKTETVVKAEPITTEVKEVITAATEEQLMPEGSAVEGDTRYDNISTETAKSDCYIVDYFIDMDIEYLTVDFVTYKLDEDSKNTDYEIYDVVNDNPKLRTFLVNTEYFDCAHNKTKSLTDLMQSFKDNPKTIFALETEDGIITELYIDVCSG